jgi:hypothetical protein
MRSTRPPPGVFYVNKVINSRRRAKVIVKSRSTTFEISLTHHTTLTNNTGLTTNAISQDTQPQAQGASQPEVPNYKNPQYLDMFSVE